VVLTRVLPGAEEGRDVLGEPDEHAYEQKRQGQRDAALLLAWSEGHVGAAEHQQHGPDEDETQIRKPVMAEEVQVDEGAKRHYEVGTGPAHEAQAQQSPRLDHETGDAGVHETAVQRYTPH